jgi:alanine-glyoxylate transaminase/(R)-3-amino-2-methylpropionate-pyruvate transaminase
MLGCELVRDRETKEPATQETLVVWEAMRELGVLVGKGGLFGNTLRIKPPMCVNAADVDFTLEVLDAALGKATGR